MISQEFRSAVANKNLLRTRIMLKDSFVVDPTFSQLREMLSYAKQILPDLLVPFDGEILEEDSSKWNQEVMNMELVQLVNNFSETRIVHLQKVVSKVMAPKVEKNKIKKNQSEQRHQCLQQKSSPLPGYTSTSQELRKQALQQIMTESTKISNVIQNVKDRKKWELTQINELEKAARQLLQATQKYKANK